MSDAERLAELLWNGPDGSLGFRDTCREVAEHLVANGVTVPVSAADVSLPEQLCGQHAPRGRETKGRCVFLKLHEGNHSWQTQR